MSILKKLLKFVGGEIANTNGLGKAKTLTLFHGFPNRFQVNWGDEVLGDGLLAWPLVAQFQRPMHQIQVQVIQLKVPNSWIDALINVRIT